MREVDRALEKAVENGRECHRTPPAACLACRDRASIQCAHARHIREIPRRFVDQTTGKSGRPGRHSLRSRARGPCRRARGSSGTGRFGRVRPVAPDICAPMAGSMLPAWKTSASRPPTATRGTCRCPGNSMIETRRLRGNPILAVLRQNAALMGGLPQGYRLPCRVIAAFSAMTCIIYWVCGLFNIC